MTPARPRPTDGAALLVALFAFGARVNVAAGADGAPVFEPAADWGTGTAAAAVVEGEPAETAGFSLPQGLAFDGDRLFVADTGRDCVRVIDGGRVRTVVGVCGAPGAAPDGAGRIADVRLHRPFAAAVLTGGRLAVADAGNDRVVLVDLAAGTARAFVGFRAPRGVVASSAAPDLVYVADTGAHRVVALNVIDGRTEAVLGIAGAPGYDESTRAAEQALAHRPADVSVLLGDGRDVLLVADTSNRSVVQLTQSNPSGPFDRRIAAGDALAPPGALPNAETPSLFTADARFRRPYRTAADRLHFAAFVLDPTAGRLVMLDFNTLSAIYLPPPAGTDYRGAGAVAVDNRGNLCIATASGVLKRLTRRPRR